MIKDCWIYYNSLPFANVTVRIKFCIYVVSILFLSRSASYKCGVSTKSFFRSFIIILMVSINLFICFWVSEFMVICLEFESTS